MFLNFLKMSPPQATEILAKQIVEFKEKLQSDLFLAKLSDKSYQDFQYAGRLDQSTQDSIANTHITAMKQLPFITLSHFQGQLATIEPNPEKQSALFCLLLSVMSQMLFNEITKLSEEEKIKQQTQALVSILEGWQVMRKQEGAEEKRQSQLIIQQVINNVSSSNRFLANVLTIAKTNLVDTQSLPELEVSSESSISQLPESYRQVFSEHAPKSQFTYS